LHRVVLLIFHLIIFGEKSAFLGGKGSKYLMIED
jgi:hypothetical protein